MLLRYLRNLIDRRVGPVMREFFVPLMLFVASHLIIIGLALPMYAISH